MKLVPMHDRISAALHVAVLSGGTFIYIPKGIKMNQALQAYFRMNTCGGGQFEHTLIVIEDNAQADYIEGGTAQHFYRKLGYIDIGSLVFSRLMTGEPNQELFLMKILTP